MTFVGQAPSSSTERADMALVGESGARLARWAGLSPGEFHARATCVNVLARWPGAAAHGDLFPLDEARVAALQLAPSLDGRRVVFCGTLVAAAFRVQNPGFFAWRTCGYGPFEFEAATIPHPSGVNRYWNLPAHVAAAERFLHELFGQPLSQHEQTRLTLDGLDLT